MEPGNEPDLDFEQLLQGLERPQAYPVPPPVVEHLSTHVSVLFFAGERVFKLKKPVDLGFVDQSTIQRRRDACDAELRLNQRISPRMYLGVRAVRRSSDGTFHIDAGAGNGSVGEIVDWVVEMLRLPKACMLESLIERNVVHEHELVALCEVLARFHAAAAAGPDIRARGEPDRLRAKLIENVDQLAAVALPHRDIVPVLWLDTLRARLARFVADRAGELAHRAASGRVVEGHGDLHAGNICLWDGEVFVYDCVEFDLDLRADDVACDLAFLVMDLDHRGHHELARRVVELYSDATNDEALPDLVRHYAAHRAAIRAKVLLFTAHDDGLDAPEHTSARRAARRYFQLALAYGMLDAMVVVLAGAGGDALRNEVARLLRREPIAAVDAAALESLDRPLVLASRGTPRAAGAAAWIEEPLSGDVLDWTAALLEAQLEERAC